MISVGGINLGAVDSNIVPTARHYCDISSKGAVLPAGAMMRKWAPPTRYTLRLSTVNVMNKRLDFNLKSQNQIFILFVKLFKIKVYDGFTGTSLALLGLGNKAHFEKMSQRSQAVGNTVSKLSGPKTKHQTFFHKI